MKHSPYYLGYFKSHNKEKCIKEKMKNYHDVSIPLIQDLSNVLP